MNHVRYLLGCCSMRKNQHMNHNQQNLQKNSDQKEMLEYFVFFLNQAIQNKLNICSGNSPVLPVQAPPTQLGSHVVDPAEGKKEGPAEGKKEGATETGPLGLFTFASLGVFTFASLGDLPMTTAAELELVALIVGVTGQCRATVLHTDATVISPLHVSSSSSGYDLC